MSAEVLVNAAVVAKILRETAEELDRGRWPPPGTMRTVTKADEHREIIAHVMRAVAVVFDAVGCAAQPGVKP